VREQMTGEVTRHRYAERSEEAKAEPLLERSLPGGWARFPKIARDGQGRADHGASATQPQRSWKGRVEDVARAQGRLAAGRMERWEKLHHEERVFLFGVTTSERSYARYLLGLSTSLLWGEVPNRELTVNERSRPRSTQGAFDGVQVPRLRVSAHVTSSASNPVRAALATLTPWARITLLDVAATGASLLLPLPRAI
jgi:hypothetical protein